MNSLGIIGLGRFGKILANIFISYSTPLNYEMQFILTNSIINLRDEKLTIIHPRDNFNKHHKLLAFINNFY